MRIKEVHIYKLELPVAGGSYRMASASVSKLDSTIVEILTDTDLKGYGETCPIGPVYQPMHALGARSALEQMGPHLIGANPLRIECVHDAMESALNGHRYAKAAVDIALWDIAGKAYGPGFAIYSEAPGRNGWPPITPLVLQLRTKRLPSPGKNRHRDFDVCRSRWAAANSKPTSPLSARCSRC